MLFQIYQNISPLHYLNFASVFTAETLPSKNPIYAKSQILPRELALKGFEAKGGISNSPSKIEHIICPLKFALVPRSFLSCTTIHQVFTFHPLFAHVSLLNHSFDSSPSPMNQSPGNISQIHLFCSMF